MAIIIVVPTVASATCSRWDSVTILGLMVTTMDQWDVMDHPVTITDQWDATDHPVRRNSSVEVKEAPITDHRISTVEVPVDVLTGHVAVK